MEKGIIFIAGVYGVGKSTLCNKISNKLCVPFYSAGDLISEVNGEVYEKNKAVKDKTTNQNILISVATRKLQSHSTYLLAGHFCIFNEKFQVEMLPEFVYKEIPISKIILLETDVKQILINIKKRDKNYYDFDSVSKLLISERMQAEKISDKFNIQLYRHAMKFDQSDTDIVSDIIKGSDT